MWCQGKYEFIGRAMARPVVKASSEKYDKPNFPPQLEWFDICRGSDRAGELLAAFELLQVHCYNLVLTKTLLDTSFIKFLINNKNLVCINVGMKDELIES